MTRRSIVDQINKKYPPISNLSKARRVSFWNREFLHTNPEKSVIPGLVKDLKLDEEPKDPRGIDIPQRK